MLAGWRGGDVVVLALGVAFLPVALMVTAEAVVGRVRPRGAAALHLVLVAAVAAILSLYAVKHETDLRSEAALAIGLATAALAAYLFGRFGPVRSFVTLLAPASLLFVGLFLLGSPVRHLVLPTEGADLSGPRLQAPVVIIVFDEFPTLSLLNARGELDRRSYPAFAKLAREGIWFRHATTVADFTGAAVPAILTGRHQDGGRPASASAHPNNLLAFIGRRGGADARENLLTRLCPADVCVGNEPRPLPGRITRVLPALAKVSLATFLPDGLYRRLPAVNPFQHSQTENAARRTPAFGRSRAMFHYLHLELPHGPWFRLPSGRPYPIHHVDFRDFIPDLPGVPLQTGIPSIAEFQWTDDRNRVTHMLQRHLAQVGYADRVLGETLDSLRSIGLYDRAMIVVTADHGIAFRPSVDARRLSRANAPGVLHVPLFVKLPGDRRGSISDRFVQSIDIAPTIASALGLRLPWRTDGRSALGDQAPGRRRLVANAVITGERLEFNASALARRLRHAATRQAALFRGTDPERIFRAGRYRALIGRHVNEIERTRPATLRYELPGDDRTLEVDPRSGSVPALVAGRVIGLGAVGRELAIVLNGRLAATAVSHPSSDGVRFEALLAERFFRSGRNQLALYAISPGARGPRLSEIPPAGHR